MKYETMFESSMPNGMQLNPHDLLWIADTHSSISSPSLPSWATPDWLRSAPAVVRRENIVSLTRVPVGLRGKTREQRHKTYLNGNDVIRVVTPEMLAKPATLNSACSLKHLPPIENLLLLAPILDGLDLMWGPTGSVGFTLASGLQVLRAESDLDLVVRAPVPLSPDAIKVLSTIGLYSSCRLDIQIDTGHGAFSLAEWTHGSKQVLLKTNIGPFLTNAPWSHRKWLPTTIERP